MTTLHEAALQALDALENSRPIDRSSAVPHNEHVEAMASLRAALATGDNLSPTEPDLSRCPKCNGPADNGHDRCIPPNTYWCSKCMAEPPQRKPLTAGEISLLWKRHTNEDGPHALPHEDDGLGFARAIERAHGIGGQDE